MVSNVHYVELYINGELVELESQSSLNLRINNVLFNPTKTTTTQAEYSFSFDIPSTPINDRILGYANNLSRINKFHARYKAEVYADGSLIFIGSLTVSKYSASTKKYTCNLVQIKINTLDEIFGETKLSDLKWFVDFDGGSTINEVNATEDSKYYFPLVSYGVFQKTYETKDEVGAEYTPKHTIDKYNRWWVESFYPSLNVTEVMKRAFESKGYKVGGSALRDPKINSIFASCNLADEQQPIYNLGNPKFGEVDISLTWNNYASNGESSQYFGQKQKYTTSTNGLDQELSFPYEKIRPAINASNKEASEQYNFNTISWWNMMDSINNPNGVSVTVNHPTYMFDPNEQVIVIPADGWYKITLDCTATLSGVGTTFTGNQYTNTFYEGDEFKQREVTFTRGFLKNTPFEVQLIRNYDDNIELIKGKTNVTYQTGDPSQQTYRYRGGSYESNEFPNKFTWETDCPHQDPYGSEAPTKMDNLMQQSYSSRNSVLAEFGNGNEYTIPSQEPNQQSSGGGTFGGSGTFGGNRKRVTRGYTNENGNFGGNRANANGATAYKTKGFMHQDNQIMPYDQAVSTAFICGMSTMSNGTLAVMRDGYSWSKVSSVRNDIFANVKGLDLINNISDNETETLSTNYCKNTYKNSSFNLTVTDSQMSGLITCCVYLNKNDTLQLAAVQRDYTGQKYSVSASCNLKIVAMNDKSKAELKADPYWNYYSDSTFPTQLNLFNFTNNDTKISEWINNINTAFNLEIVQDGENIEINTNQGLKKVINYAIDIDDRVSTSEAEAEYISYPREMSVRYKIDTDEWGFELTIPEEHINDEGDEWKNWGDSGFTVIKLSDDTYETSTQNVQTQFSYTYYDNFLWKEVFSDGTEGSSSGKTITIPVIEKAEYMAEGYGYDEAMKHDGYSLTQRFWYRGKVSQEYIWLSSHMEEKIWLTYPINNLDRFNLSYKDSEKSIVTEYFNVSPMLNSNYVNVEVFLTPDEYNSIKGGALVHFDSDLYYTSEISGYDPSGSNRTKLKLIKKT